MACMCGDTHCPSCGPAQGNFRCPVCRAWADDGCEHIDEETGEMKPEFEAAKEEADRREEEYWNEWAKRYDELNGAPEGDWDR